MKHLAPADRRAPRGLTLIEVVISIALTIGLMGAALGFYRHVVDVRQQFTGQLARTQRTAARRMVMDRITGELRSAMVYPFLGLGMSGQAMEMRFVTAAVPHQTAWAAEGITDAPVEPEQDLRIVGYRLRYVEDEEGFEVIEGLERSVQKTLTAQVVEEGQEVRFALMAPQIKFVRFGYWDNEAGEWLPDWEGGDLPMAVEIALGAEPLPEDMEPEEYPYETFRRVVYVPGGSRAFGGTTIIRGLGESGR